MFVDLPPEIEYTPISEKGNFSLLKLFSSLEGGLRREIPYYYFKSIIN
jgi:hypothetical protein